MSDGAAWAIINASPDIRQQMQDRAALHPRALRDTPVASVLLTNGDIDHVAGLLSLRERTPFRLLATQAILDVLAQNPIFEALAPDVVTREAVSLETPFALLEGVTAELFPVPGKVPLYMEGEEVQTDLMGEQTVGVRLAGGGRVGYYIPGCAHVTDDLRTRLADADVLFFDGTLWDDQEMIRTGTGHKTGRRMGHISMSGAEGSMAALRGVGGRRIYVHINNTNPVLQPASPERAQVEASGWEIAFDGMEIEP